MVSLFLGLTIANLAALVGAAALGYVSAWRPEWRGYHLLVGASAALLCVGVHCVVFTYFVATAKWVQHAIDVRGLDPALAAPTKSFKAMAFPAALLCMASVFAAACLGAARDALGTDAAWHHVGALCAIAINVGGAAVEYRAVVRNGRLIDDVLARIGTQR
jgi:hypothetical protein